MLQISVLFILVGIWNVGFATVVFDLNSGIIYGSDSAITPVVPLAGGGGSCDFRGVYKVHFDLPSPTSKKTKLKIEMKFESPYQWVFNIGDSSTNNGWAGDSGTQMRDCEMEGYSSYFQAYGNDYSHSTMFKNQKILPTTTDETFTIVIEDGAIIYYKNSPGGVGWFDYLLEKYFMFALDGQTDPGGVNSDIYIGMNRVIHPRSYRKGKGLCKLSLTWL